MRATALFLMLGILGAVAAGCSKDSANDSFTSVGNNQGHAKEDKWTTPTAAEERHTKDGGKTIAMGKALISGKRSDAGPTGTVDADPLSVPGDIVSGEIAFSTKKLESTTDKAAKDAAKSEVVAIPPPAVAEAVVGKAPGKAPKQTGPKSGILTAGSFDDNVDPGVFNRYVKKMSQRQGLGDLTGKLQGQRLSVSVRDSAGKPVGNARVKLSAGGSAFELTTRSDGRAIFILSLDQLPTDQALLATVTSPNGAIVTETIEAGSARWEIAVPAPQAQLPKNLDLAIILDTTGSMGDELEHLKAEIRGISGAIAKQFPEVKQRFALICYRDEGDEYVVRPFDFTESLDVFHKNLSGQSANGGGDYPEAMHKGLAEANQLRWKEDKDTVRVAFLIADAPPHAQHMNSTLTAANNLRKKGVALYPVACSGYDDACEFVMRSCALLTGSQFLFLTDDSGVGNSHAEPSIPYYQVERLERLMTRMIASELSGQRIAPNPADVLRTVGRKVN